MQIFGCDAEFGPLGAFASQDADIVNLAIDVNSVFMFHDCSVLVLFLLSVVDSENAAKDFLDSPLCFACFGIPGPCYAAFDNDVFAINDWA